MTPQERAREPVDRREAVARIEREARALHAIAEDLLASDDEAHAAGIFMATAEIRRQLALLEGEGEPREPLGWVVVEHQPDGARTLSHGLTTRDEAQKDAAEANIAMAQHGCTYIVEPVGAHPPAPAKSEWRPIETAPRDGTEILVPTEGGSTIACWGTPDEMYGPPPPDLGLEADNDARWYEHFGAEMLTPPTHWQPLPAPPAPSDAHKESER